MKKLKKFKRFDKGGFLTDSSGNPVLSGDGTPVRTMEDTETPEEKYAKRREGYEDIKNFFMGRRSKDEPSAPIEEREPPKSERAETRAPAKTPAKPTVTASVTKPQVSSSPPTPAEASSPAQSTAVNRGETSYDYPTQRGSFNRDDYEGGASPTSGGQTFKRAAPKAGSAKPPKAAEKAPATSSKPKGSGAGDSDDSVDTKKKNELERLKRVGSGAVEQTMMGPVEAIAFGASKLPSMARAGFGAARKAYNEFTKPTPKEAPKTEPKLDSKSEPKQGQLFDEAGQPTPAALGKPAPKEAPKAEPKVETKSGAIQPKGTGPSEAGRKAMEGSKGSLKDQAKDAINKQRAADKDPRGPISGGIKPTGKGPSEAGSKLMREAGGNKPTGPERLPLKEQAKEAINAQRASDKDPRGPITEGSRSARPARPESKPIKPTGAGPSEAGKKLMERAKNQSSTILEKERKPDLMMQEYISGREAARNRIKDLPDDGLSVPRYEMKKGGKIPAFKKGGLVGRADGCAIRGKTKGRMV